MNKIMLGIAFILCTAQVSADEEKAKAQWRVCASCHGQQAQGMGGFPNLAVQPEADLVEALTDYKNMMNRGDMSQLMWGQAANLSDEDIKALAKYIVTTFGNK